MSNDKAEDKKPLSTKDKLKALKAQKKKINDEQKALREEFSKGKTERTEAGKEKATARKAVRTTKSTLRELGATINDTFKGADVDAIDALADSIEKASAELVESIRAFANAEDKLNEL